MIWFVGCNPTRSNGSIDLSENNSISLFDLIERVEVIPLETTPESFIAEVRRVIAFQSKFYVLDAGSQQIFCFGQDGSFDFKISSVGNGPAEYIYVSDIAIDDQNKRLLLLDPVGQKVLGYDLQGSFIQSWLVRSQYALGLRQVYPVNDSVLLFTALNHEQLVLYDTRRDSLFAAYYDLGVRHLEGFAPRRHVFQVAGRTFFLPPLSRELVDFTSGDPEPSYNWCFGENNNSPQQISKLLEQIRSLPPNSYDLLIPFQGVGRGKALNHHINGVFETTRFRLAFVEFGGKQKHVIIDKKQGSTHIFELFREGIVLPEDNLHSGTAIAFYQEPFSQDRINRRLQQNPDYPLEFFTRRAAPRFNHKIMDAHQRQIIDNHDPMTDNPFLVVYTFME